MPRRPKLYVGKSYTVTYLVNQRSGATVEFRGKLIDIKEPGTPFEKLVFRRPNSKRNTYVHTRWLTAVARHEGAE